jgi:hypothetical protein
MKERPLPEYTACAADLLCFATGGMPQKAIQWARKMLPKAGRPDMAATAAMLRQLEQQGALASSAHRLKLDAFQMHAISTALLNPLTLLHGPPGTGKTTTFGGLLYCLRCVLDWPLVSLVAV